MDWFEQLTGVKETTGDAVRKSFTIDGQTMTSLANGRTMRQGTLTTPSLAALRAASERPARGRLRVRELIADVKALHADPRNEGAFFQVASQCNLLEMVGPEVTPERGIAGYEWDRTQGPACAIAAGAGTIYRNYFVPVGDGIGQTAGRQIDCLADLGAALGNEDQRLWRMQNGYALPSEQGLRVINARLRGATESDSDMLRGQLRIGIQQDTEVTISPTRHCVTQAYCSAMPVAYSGLPPVDWQAFAVLVLEAAYEATLHAARMNALRTGVFTCYLTLLGGGAFGNDPAWIGNAARRALEAHRDADLDVVFVGYRSSQPIIQHLVTTFA